MKFCEKCGHQVDDEVKFCPECGHNLITHQDSNSQPIYNIYMQNPGNSSGHREMTGYDNYDEATLEMLFSKIQTSATIWMVIGIVQVVCGVCTACFVYGIAPLALGIWNVINSNTIKKNVEVFRQDPSRIVPYFESQKTMTIVFLVLNVIFGALFGIIGSIYDLTIHSFVEQNLY